MAVESALQVVPAVEGKSLDEMSTAELLRNAAHNGLKRLNEIILWAPEKDNVPLTRLILDAANSTGKLLARVEEAGLRVAVATDAIADLGSRLKAIERSQARSEKAAAKKASAAEKT